MSDDVELLREYAAHQSEAAFETLVTRHVGLVHSAALRQVRHAQLAEEITQTVFIILARKAGSLGPRTILPGWLYRTTRYAAGAALKMQSRRERREQEAHMQAIVEQPGSDPVWEQLSPLLDEALAQLREKDRAAILVRYFQNKDLREVGAALGVDEYAAQKRVGRALEKLRTFFSRHGVDSNAAVIAGSISVHSIQAVPATLSKSVVASAMAKGIVGGGSSLILAKATLFAMKGKIIFGAVAALTVALVAISGYLAFERFHPRGVPPLAAAIDSVPIKLANDSFLPGAGPRFLHEVDAGMRRTTNSQPAGHIKCLMTPTSSGSGDYLKSINGGPSQGQLDDSSLVRYRVTEKSVLFGKRIRITGWMKTSDVRNWAGVTLLIYGVDGHVYADDEMTDRPIHGTVDWQPIEIVTDVPAETCTIFVGPAIYGTGDLWVDDFQIDTASPDAPITDDRIWHVWSPNPNDYSVSPDSETLHNGNTTLCISYVPKGGAPRGSWMWWGEDIRTPEKYRGHTVRMTAWIKAENVTQISQNLRPKGSNFKLLANCSHSPVNGTSGWLERVITCFIPKGTQCLDTGFAFDGSGKVWIDMKSLKYEIVD